MNAVHQVHQPDHPARERKQRKPRGPSKKMRAEYERGYAVGLNADRATPAHKLIAGLVALAIAFGAGAWLF